MIRVFLDATVLFSAARDPDGMNRNIFKVAKKRGDVVLLCTWVIVDDADIKLMFAGLAQARGELKNLVAERVNLCPLPPVELNQNLAPLIPDPHDAPVLAGAVFAGADCLITANTKHFRHLYGRKVRNVLVLEPEGALRQLTAGA